MGALIKNHVKANVISLLAMFTVGSLSLFSENIWKSPINKCDYYLPNYIN